MLATIDLVSTVLDNTSRIFTFKNFYACQRYFLAVLYKMVHNFWYMFSFDLSATCVNKCLLTTGNLPSISSSLCITGSKLTNSSVGIILYKVNEKRTVVKFFHEQNCSPAKIFQLLKKYGISRLFIHRTIKRLN